MGIRVSPRTVGKYVERGNPRGNSGQRWTTFVRNHVQAIVACDFFVSVTASFRLQYVFVAIEVGSRRILHANVTAHPTAEWTTQQFREFLVFDHSYRFVIHDRDAVTLNFTSVTIGSPVTGTINFTYGGLSSGAVQANFSGMLTTFGL